MGKSLHLYALSAGKNIDPSILHEPIEQTKPSLNYENDGVLHITNHTVYAKILSIIPPQVEKSCI